MLINLCTSMLNQRVKINNVVSEGFESNSGVRQGE